MKTRSSRLKSKTSWPSLQGVDKCTKRFTSLFLRWNEKHFNHHNIGTRSGEENQKTEVKTYEDQVSDYKCKEVATSIWYDETFQNAQRSSNVSNSHDKITITVDHMQKNISQKEFNKRIL